MFLSYVLCLAQVCKTYHPTLRETCLLTFASYVVPASEAGIYKVRHVYKLTATNTTTITGGEIGLHNKTMDKCYCSTLEA